MMNKLSILFHHLSKSSHHNINNIIPSIITTLLLFLCIFSSQVSCFSTHYYHNKPRSRTKPPPLNYYHHTNINLNYIKRSCRTTLYPRLCFRSLSTHATTIKTSPKLLATTALHVTFNKTRSTSRTLEALSKKWGLRPREKESLVECVEEVGDSVDELRQSVKKLNHSRRSQSNFDLKMNDLQTWVSAALTDDGTCMDDFEVRGKMKVLVRRKVWKIARLTSIALAFINKYAGTVY